MSRVLMGCGITILLGLTACSNRTVEMEIHTPENCCEPASVVPSCEEPACPLSRLGAVMTRVTNAGGSLLAESCTPVASACVYEDLSADPLLLDLPPSMAVEIEATGYADESCTGPVVFRCDSFGDASADLASEDPVALFCSCPAP